MICVQLNVVWLPKHVLLDYIIKYSNSFSFLKPLYTIFYEFAENM